MEFLEGVYLVRRLLPFSANLSKRLVKSPRSTCGFRDPARPARKSAIAPPLAAPVGWSQLRGLRGRADPRGPVGTRCPGRTVLLSHQRRSRNRSAASRRAHLGGDRSQARRDGLHRGHVAPRQAADMVGAEHRYLVCQTARSTLAKTAGSSPCRALASTEAARGEKVVADSAA